MTTAVEQPLELIPREALLDKVRALKLAGYRLVHITATRLPESVELTYGFDRELHLTSLRITLPPAEGCVPSISTVYACAVLYENELHDLFNVQVQGMTLDFKGKLYQTMVKFPFGSTRPPAVVKPDVARAAQ